MNWITNPEIWISLVTLTVLEIVLGIDNFIFISILSGKLPEHQQRKARQLELTAALIARILLLANWRGTSFGRLPRRERSAPWP